MKLAKALKTKKRLAAEIAHLKNIINSKNSYPEDDKSVTIKYDTYKLLDELEKKTEELINLKIIINEANLEIQPSLYKLSEIKSIISFLDSLNVTEGFKEDRYLNTNDRKYSVQIDGLNRDKIKASYQSKADALQDSIDTYNYTTEVMWGEDYTEKGGK